MKDELAFDEDDGSPIRRVTIRLKGRSDAQIEADMKKLRAILARGNSPQARP